MLFEICDLLSWQLPVKLYEECSNIFHQVKNYKCAECGYSCYLKTDLERHLTNVHQKQRTACPVCGKRYSDLRQHIRLVHEGHKVIIFQFNVKKNISLLVVKNIWVKFFFRMSVFSVIRNTPTSVNTSTRCTRRSGRLSVINVEKHSILRVSWGDMCKMCTATDSTFHLSPLHFYTRNPSFQCDILCFTK